MTSTPEDALRETTGLGAGDGGDISPQTNELPVLPEFDDPDDDSQSWSGRDLLLLLGVTVLAAGLRLLGLHEWSMWVDESHTYRDATSPIGLFWTTNPADYPVAYLMLRALLDVLPATTEGWLRLPFAFAGILTIPLLAVVGRSIVGRRAALIAALLLAVSPWHIYWSQNVRGYSLVMLFVVSSIGLFWLGIQRASIVAYVLSVGALIAAGMTHPTAYAIGGVYLTVAFLTLWTRPGVYRTGLIVWSVLILGGLGVLLSIVAGGHFSWFTGAKSNPSLVHFAQTTGFFLGPALIVSAIGGFFALRHSANRAGGLFVALWAFLPILACAAVSVGFVQTTAQYVFSCLPAFCLLAGALGAELARRVEKAGSRRAALRFALPLVLVAQMGAYDFLYFTKQHGDRPRWREAAQHVLEQPDDKVLVLTTNLPSMLFYLHPGAYWGQDNREHRIVIRGIETWDVRDAGGGDVFLRDQQVDALAHDQRMFVVVTQPEFDEKDPTGKADGWLRRNGRVVETLPAWAGPKDMTVLVYEVPRVEGR